MMKHLMAFLFVLIFVSGFSLHAQADLFNRGTDTHGNRLIYDSDLNITWYDYTNSPHEWGWQMSWADSLTVNLGGTIFNDWRLPATVDGPYVYGTNGTTTGGYNITSSEMGHLFYTELGNKGYYDTSGNPQPGWGLTNTGLFQNLEPFYYWSGTSRGGPYAISAWDFDTSNGKQATDNKAYYGCCYLNAIAVRAGDVVSGPPVVPEPISSVLFLTGGATLIGRKYLRRK